MTVKEKQAIHERQERLMLEKEYWRELQGEFVYNEDFFHLCCWAMQTLDEMCDQLRYVLEMESGKEDITNV